MCHSILPEGVLKLSFTKAQCLHTVCALMGALANPQSYRHSISRWCGLVGLLSSGLHPSPADCNVL